MSGLGKGEADVDPTEVNFALILCLKYPAVDWNGEKGNNLLRVKKRICKKIVSITKSLVF